MSLHHKRSQILAVMLLTGAVPFASANGFDDFARVVSVTPQYEQVNHPRQECVTEYVQVQRPAQDRGMAGAVIGGIAGGLLGNQVGGGSGRTAATAAGAIAGTIVGDRIENSNQPGTVVEQQPVQRCRTVDNWQTRANGFSVTYEYRGFMHTTTLPNHPGERLPVRVSVTPRM
ncbi:MAG TPA: glycine zipper 2TM domain-containing protein [Noviherbaspirillum sp.]|nr:glycine zipper 2TM domain-containing protein [Noviherbaspirillum sp.]